MGSKDRVKLAEEKRASVGSGARPWLGDTSVNDRAENERRMTEQGQLMLVDGAVLLRALRRGHRGYCQTAAGEARP